MTKKKKSEKRKKEKETEEILKYIENVERGTASEIKRIMKANLPEEEKKKEVNELLKKVGLTREDVLKLQEKGLI